MQCALTGCRKPPGWCKHEGAQHQTMDCDEDGINDCLCTDTRGRMWTMLSSKGFKSEGGDGTAQCKALQALQGKSPSMDLNKIVNLVVNFVIN